jgi:hypothetical protein
MSGVWGQFDALWAIGSFPTFYMVALKWRSLGFYLRQDRCLLEYSQVALPQLKNCMCICVARQMRLLTEVRHSWAHSHRTLRTVSV